MKIKKFFKFFFSMDNYYDETDDFVSVYDFWKSFDLEKLQVRQLVLRQLQNKRIWNFFANLK
jgi:hypothetical protein